MDIPHLSVSPLPVMNEGEKDNSNDHNGMKAPPPTQFSPAQQLFFRQLHAMLMQESSNVNGCVKWLDDAKGFTITDKDSFSVNILRRYFNEAKYASFTRRLKRWGFKRITKGPDSGAYYHDSFHRDMSFDDYEEDIGSDISECSPSESSQSLPPKKRMMRSPDPVNARPYADSFDTLCNRNVDVSVMPEIMREINRSKRFERSDFMDYPEAKRTKFGNGSFYSGSSAAASMPSNSNYGFNSFGNSRRQDLAQDRLDYLSRLKRQVFEENQGNFNMEPVQSSRGNFKSSMESLSHVSTEILKREIQMRRMEQGFACSNNSNQSNFMSNKNQMSNGMFNRQSFFDMNMPNMNMSSRAAASMDFPSYYNNNQTRSNNGYDVRAMGALKDPTDFSDMSPMQQGWNPSNNASISSMQQQSWKPSGVAASMKDMGFNFTYDSAKVPIPGLDEMKPKKNPFNRAA